MLEQHSKLIAGVLRAVRAGLLEEAETPDVLNEGRHADMIAGVDEVIEAFADVIRFHDAKFSRDAFLKACRASR